MAELIICGPYNIGQILYIVEVTQVFFIILRKWYDSYHMLKFW